MPWLRVQLLYRPWSLGRWVTRFVRRARLVHTRDLAWGIDLWNVPPLTLVLPRRIILCLSPSLSLPCYTYMRFACVCVCKNIHARTRMPCRYTPFPLRVMRTLLSFPLDGDAFLSLSSVRIPSATCGVTASFGWVRARETDKNKAGMCKKGGRICQIPTEVCALQRSRVSWLRRVFINRAGYNCYY